MPAVDAHAQLGLDARSVALRRLGWLSFLSAFGLASGGFLPLTAAGQAAWLVQPIDVGAASDPAARMLRETEQALRARGLVVIEARNAAVLFEREHSRAPYAVQLGELESLDALLRRLEERLAADDLPGVQGALAVLASLPLDKQDLLNGDMRRARRRFHACVSAAYLLDRSDQPAPAQEQISTCARDFPGFDPELPGVASDSARAFLARAKAALAALAPSTLRIEASGAGAGVHCFARVNGMDRGRTPMTLDNFRLPRVRIQVDCGKQPGRIYDVSVADPAAKLNVDVSLDAAVQSRAGLSLSYPDARTADALRVKHGVILARAVGATQLLQLFGGKLRRIDVASGRELGRVPIFLRTRARARARTRSAGSQAQKGVSGRGTGTGTRTGMTTLIEYRDTP